MIVRTVPSRAARAATRAAFTLMEIMVVVAIIVILAGVSVVAVTRYMEEARISATKVKIAAVETAASTWFTAHGEYPSDLHLLTSPEQGRTTALLEPSQIEDEWHQPLVIDVTQKSATGKPLIYSPGAPGSNQRITNFDATQ
jgi:general secretion pathway protein G